MESKQQMNYLKHPRDKMPVYDRKLKLDLHPFATAGDLFQLTDGYFIDETQRLYIRSSPDNAKIFEKINS